jgi:hypothetical protein
MVLSGGRNSAIPSDHVEQILIKQTQDGIVNVFVVDYVAKIAIVHPVKLLEDFRVLTMSISRNQGISLNV